MNKIPALFDEMIVDKRNSQSFLKLTQNKLNFLRDLSTAAAFMMNFLFIYSFYFEFQYSDGGNTPTRVQSDLFGFETDYYLRLLGYSQLFTSLSALVLFLKNRSQIIYFEFWRNRFRKLRPIAKAQKGISSLKSSIPASFPITDERIAELLKKDPRNLKRSEYKAIVMFERGIKEEDKHYTYLYYETLSILCIFNHPFVRYLIFYVLVSFGGSFVSSLWYLLHLYDVAVPLPLLFSHVTYHCVLEPTAPVNCLEERRLRLHQGLHCVYPGDGVLGDGHLLLFRLCIRERL